MGCVQEPPFQHPSPPPMACHSTLACEPANGLLLPEGDVAAGGRRARASPLVAKPSKHRFNGFSWSLGRCVLGGPRWAQMAFSMAGSSMETRPIESIEASLELFSQCRDCSSPPGHGAAGAPSFRPWFRHTSFWTSPACALVDGTCRQGATKGFLYKIRRCHRPRRRRHGQSSACFFFV